ncbi:hypothetical protein [Actinoplanes sp. NPDC051851]|uniref:hypothetical protein n=1 Tax=Actinoplanes sp. NPDC051851 TaxID=3154753 RepID=UPI0034379ED6
MEISDDELLRMVDEACEDDDPTRLEEVARVRPDLIAPFHLRLAVSGVFWVAAFYQGMTEETAAELVRRADNPAYLHVLGASGTRAAVEAIRGWAADPPSWLTVPLDGAGHAGGWELGPDGERRDLVSRSAHALDPAADGPIVTGAVTSGPFGELCGWCEMPLLCLLEADGALLPGLLAPGPFAVWTCVRCGCYTTYYTEGGSFAAGQTRPGFLGYEADGWGFPEAEPLRIGAPRPTPWAASAWSAGNSTLGGFPDWIQDPEFPACPRCDRTMPFVGMITGSDLWGEAAEGCHYLFHDQECGLSAAVYQQS